MHDLQQSAPGPRILFYLPAVTPWWFTHILVPMIRAATRGGEVHVLVPPLWSCTGIRAEELAGCDDLPVTWHILDQDDHAELRFSKRHEGIVDLVRRIDPDLSLCRSADIVTPSAFPGIVRYIMEAAADPFGTAYWNVQLCESLFEHGLMPAIGPARAQWLEDALVPHWAGRMAAFPSMARDAFLESLGIPAGKILIGLPLEFTHEEVFWDQHNPYPSNSALVAALADRLDDDVMLLTTQHPINERNPTRDSLAVQLDVLARRDKVRMVRDTSGPGIATRLMLRHCDGMIVGHSKSFAAGAFLGKPMLHMSIFGLGDWLGAYAELPAFVEALRSGTARAATRSDALRWFAFHHANAIIDPLDPALDLPRLMDHALHPVNPARWERGLARYFGEGAALLPPLPSDVELPALAA